MSASLYRIGRMPEINSTTLPGSRKLFFKNCIEVKSLLSTEKVEDFPIIQSTLEASLLNRVNSCKVKHELELLGEQIPKERFWEVIELSKTSDRISQASANAISALNCMGGSFSGKSLQYVRIPGASLSRGRFHRTNFSDSDLRGVNFDSAFLDSALFNRANLSGVDFGQEELKFSSNSNSNHSSCTAVLGNMLAIGESRERWSKDKALIHVFSMPHFDNVYTLEQEHEVTNLAFTPDGLQLISTGGAEVKIWDLKTKDLLKTFYTNYVYKKEIEEHLSVECVEKLEKTGCIKPVIDYPDYVAVSVNREDFEQGGIQDLKQVLEFFGKKIGTQECTVSLSLDKPLLACQSNGGAIYIWELKTFSLLHFITDSDIKRGLFFGRDNASLIFVAKEKIHLLDIATNSVIHTWASPYPVYLQIAVSRHRDFIAAVGFEGLTIWSFDSLEPIKILYSSLLAQHRGGVFDIPDLANILAFSESDKYIAVGAHHEVSIWNTYNGSLVKRITGSEFIYGVTGIEFVERDQYLVVTFNNETPKIYKIEETFSQASEIHPAEIKAISLTPDNQFLFSLSIRTLRIWDGFSGNFLWKLEDVYNFALFHDSKLLLTKTEKTVCLWDLETKTLMFEVYRSTEVRGIGILSDGRIAIIEENKIETYDINTKIWYPILNGKVQHLTCYAFSDTGRYLAFGTADGTLKAWDSDTGNFYTRRKVLHSKIVDIKFQKEIIVARSESKVSLWNPLENKFEKYDDFNDIAFIPSHRDLIILQKRSCQELGVYQLKQEGALLHSMVSHPQAPLSQYLGELDSDKMNLYDDFGRLKQWCETSEQIYMSDHRDSFSFSTMAQHPAKPILAVGGDNGMVQLWNPLYGELLNVLWGHRAKITHIRFSQDGNSFISASEDRTLQRWDITKGVDQATLTWRTEPLALVFHWVNAKDAKTDTRSNQLFNDKALTAEGGATLHWLLKNEKSYRERPYVFPPENSVDYFSDIEVKSHNLDQAIRFLHHNILKQPSNHEVINSFLSHHPKLIKLIPASFHFILKEMQSVANAVMANTIADPVSLNVLQNISASETSQHLLVVRELLDVKLRKIIGVMLSMPINVDIWQKADEVEFKTGDIFFQENCDVRAMICYAKSLGANHGNAIAHFKLGLLLIKNNPVLATKHIWIAQQLSPCEEYNTLAKALEGYHCNLHENQDNPAMFYCLLTIGLAWKSGKNNEKAKGYFKEALKVAEGLHTIIDLNEKEKILYHLGNVSFALKDFADAITYLSRALELQKKSYPSVAIAKTLNILGICYLYQKDSIAAKISFAQALEPALATVGEKDELTQKIQRNLNRLQNINL